MTYWETLLSPIIGSGPISRVAANYLMPPIGTIILYCISWAFRKAGINFASLLLPRKSSRSQVMKPREIVVASSLLTIFTILISLLPFRSSNLYDLYVNSISAVLGMWIPIFLSAYFGKWLFGKLTYPGAGQYWAAFIAGITGFSLCARISEVLHGIL